MVIIDDHPLGGKFPHFLQAPKQVEIQDLIPVRAVLPFDKGILGGTAGLNAIDQHAISFSPILKGLSEEIWSVVHANHLREFAFGLQAFKNTNHPFGLQRRINFNGYNFLIEVINDIEGPKPRAMIEGITHEVS